MKISQIILFPNPKVSHLQRKHDIWDIYCRITFTNLRFYEACPFTAFTPNGSGFEYLILFDLKTKVINLYQV